MSKYLLDSNAAIDYIGGILPQNAIDWLDGIIESEVSMSVINQIEVLGFNPLNSADLMPFEELVKTVSIINLNDAVIQATIQLRKRYKIKLPDAIVAATGIVFDLSVITRNLSDFGKIQGLKVVNPHDLK